MSSRKKVRAVLFLALAVVLVAVTRVVWWDLLFRHDYRLMQLSRECQAIGHPAQTRHIATSKRLGLLFANGNHCDYLVVQFREYAGDAHALSAFYADAAVASPVTGERLPVYTGIYHGDSCVTNYPAADEDIVRALRDARQRHARKLQDTGHWYCIFVIDHEDEAGIDIRCM